MAQTALETAASSPYCPLVTLSYGSGPTVVRYARHTSDLTIGADTFTAEPAMEIGPIRHTGDTEDHPVELTLPKSLTLPGLLVAGHAMPTVSVKIEECDPTDAANTRRTLYRGVVATARANPAGRSSLAKLVLQSVKASLKNIRLGVLATTTCQWRLGDDNCGVDLDSLKVQASCELNVGGDPRRVKLNFTDDATDATYIADPDGNVVKDSTCNLLVDHTTDTDDGGTSTPPDLFYARGYLEHDGLRILIRQHVGNGVFDLARTPPPSWGCAVVTVAPGCDKTIATCRDVYDAEDRFGGFGYALPSRNPVFEDE